MTVALGGSVLLLDGCNVFNDIENWVPVGEAALNGIVKILTTAGVMTPSASAIVTALEAAFAQLLADIKLYQSITPPPAGALAKVMAGLQIIVSNFQAFLNALSINNSVLLSTIVGLVQVILSTIAAFEGQLPTPATVKLDRFTLQGSVYTFEPVMRSRRQFKRDFNAVARAGGHPEAQIPLSLWDRL